MIFRPIPPPRLPRQGPLTVGEIKCELGEFKGRGKEDMQEEGCRESGGGNRGWGRGGKEGVSFYQSVFNRKSCLPLC